MKTILLLCCLLWASPAWCLDSLAIGTGIESSATYRLTKQLSPLWQTHSKNTNLTLGASPQPSYRRAKAELLAGRLDLAFLPLNMTHGRSLRILAVVWDIYLIPFRLDDDSSPFQWGGTSVFLDQTDGVFDSGTFAPELVGLPSSEFRQQVTNGEPGNYLKETVASFTGLQSFLGHKIYPAELDSTFAHKLKANLPWLQNRKFRLGQQYQTVGYTLVLAAREDLDLELGHSLYEFLCRPPKTIWGSSQWTRSLLADTTEKQSPALLHPAIFYQKPK